MNYEIIGKLDLALSAYQKSLKISEKRKDSFGIAQTWINIALLKSKAGNHRDALQLNQKARNYFLKIGDDKHLGLTYLNASLFYYEMRDQEKAIENALMGKISFENIKDTSSLIKTYTNLSNSFIELENLERADFYYQNAQSLNNHFEIQGAKLNVLAVGIELNLKKMDPARAKILIDEAEKTLANYPDAKDNINLPFYKVKLNAYVGNKAGFEQAIKDYEKNNKNLITNILNSQYKEWSIIYEKEKLTKTINNLKQINKIKTTTIFVNTVVIMFLVFALVATAIFYFELQKSYRKIYQLNSSDSKIPFSDNLSGDHEDNDSKLYFLFSEMQKLMEEKKFYQKPGITISELSTALISNDKYISQSIHRYAGMNFNQYINTLRIQEAKKIFEKNQTISVQQVAEICGFGNSSSFIRAFKSIIGLTPAYYVSLSKKSS